MDTSVPLVTPSAAYPPPTDEELAALKRIGSEFHVDAEKEALPVDPQRVS